MCFGEALWDVLPAGIFVGGAPLNVAYHLSRHGVHARIVTALGRDFLGDEMLRRLRAWQVDARFAARLPDRPTGAVVATIDGSGSARYDIRRGAAWDRIPVTPALRRERAPDALVFGSLALREQANRDALARLSAAWPRAWRVLDLNLRAPFTRPAVIAFALRQAQFLKLNLDELAVLAGRRLRTAASIERAAREVATTHGLARMCVTAGERGAGLWWDGAWQWENARPVVVRDTVGAGDAFLAALLSAILRGSEKPGEALARACRMGEFVAARAGATPAYAIDARGRVVR